MTGRRIRSAAANHAAGVLVFLGMFPIPLYAAHPLITDDTGTQGKGGFQLELITERGHEHEDGTTADAVESRATLSYGFHDRADAIVSVPHLKVATDDGVDRTTVNARADVGFDIKWRFYESEGGRLSFALKPGATFATGDEEVGLGTGRRNYSLFFIATFDTDPWTTHLHAGYMTNHNVLGELDRMWHISFGGWRSVFGKKLKFIWDVGNDTNPDQSSDKDIRFAILGFIYSPTEDFDVDFGVKWGVTTPETDRTLLAGIAVRW